MYSKSFREARLPLIVRCFVLALPLIIYLWYGCSRQWRLQYVPPTAGQIPQHLSSHRNKTVFHPELDSQAVITSTTRVKSDGLGRLDFLVSGVQKGGTTALNEYLLQHKYISLPKDKESHFFDNETMDWSQPDYATYESLMDTKTENVAAGEATPIYIYWPESLERIKRYNPNIKIILVYRQPVQRAWSHWKMEHARKTDTVPFSYAIRQGRDRLLQEKERPGFSRIFSYVERGFYGQQLQRLLRLFPREQLLLLRSEDLRKDPTEVVARISRFLGVPEPTRELKQLEANVSPEPEIDAVLSDSDAAYLQEIYNDDLRLFQELSGLEIPDWFV